MLNTAKFKSHSWFPCFCSIKSTLLNRRAETATRDLASHPRLAIFAGAVPDGPSRIMMPKTLLSSCPAVDPAGGGCCDPADAVDTALQLPGGGHRTEAAAVTPRTPVSSHRTEAAVVTPLTPLSGGGHRRRLP